MSDAALTTLLTRLEQVTGRLEKLEKAVASGGSCGGGAAAASSGGESGAASVAAFDGLVAGFSGLKGAVEKIADPAVKTQFEAFLAALGHERALLNEAAQSKKPANLQAFLTPTSTAMAEVGAVREKNRASKNPNHLTALSEAVNALGWVAVTPTPGPFVDEARQATEFYTNRILKDFKGKDDNHVGFANGVIQFLKDLRVYVKDFHTTELTWNAKGGNATVPAGGAAPAAAAAPAAGAPPPPASLAADIAAAKPAEEPKPRGNLFAEINKGDVTSGLKKVDKSQMTHKNPALRAGSTVPTETKAKGTPAGPAAKAPAKVLPPKLELQGNKWVVENFRNDQNVVITETEPRQVVYVYKCENSVIQVKGKINAITVDNCKKCGIVFEEAIATCEVVNCTSLQVQVTATIPSIAVDNTSGCQIFVNYDTMSRTEIVTSKSCEMNVAFTDPKTQELVELPLPEQFKTTIVNGKSVTHSVEHV